MPLTCTQPRSAWLRAGGLRLIARALAHGQTGVAGVRRVGARAQAQRERRPAGVGDQLLVAAGVAQSGVDLDHTAIIRTRATPALGGSETPTKAPAARVDADPRDPCKEASPTA